MADEEGVDVGRDLPAFSASFLDKTEYIFQSYVGKGGTETHAEVIDQSIRMLRDFRDIGTNETPGRFLLRYWKNCVNWDSVRLRLEKYWVFQGGRFTGECKNMVCKI